MVLIQALSSDSGGVLISREPSADTGNSRSRMRQVSEIECRQWCRELAKALCFHQTNLNGDHNGTAWASDATARR